MLPELFAGLAVKYGRVEVTNLPNCEFRLAMLSPFLEESHATERMVIEWLSRVTGDFGLHICRQYGEDFDPPNSCSIAFASRPALTLSTIRGYSGRHH
jgi:hypothetical protein